MRIKTKFLLSCLVISASLAMSACAANPPEPANFTVEMTEFAFDPALIEVQVGQQVTLNLVNKGNLEHELMIGRDVVYEDNRPNGFAKDLFQVGGVSPEISGGVTPEASMDDSHLLDHSGTMVVVPANDTASITFNVTRQMLGEWEIGCFSQQGVHYDAGMAGKFIVNR